MSRAMRVGAASGPATAPGFAGRELMNLLAEIRPRRGPDPADRDGAALSEIDLVEVGLENPLLGVARFDERGQPCFAKLPDERPLRAAQPHLDDLLPNLPPPFL